MHNQVLFLPIDLPVPMSAHLHDFAAYMQLNDISATLWHNQQFFTQLLTLRCLQEIVMRNNHFHLLLMSLLKQCSISCLKESIFQINKIRMMIGNSIVPPVTFALDAKIPMAAFIVTDLPEPDSPTIATVSPFIRSILTPRMACTLPAVVWNVISRSRIF